MAEASFLRVTLSTGKLKEITAKPQPLLGTERMSLRPLRTFRIVAQKAHQRAADWIRLLLLQPMTGAIKQSVFPCASPKLQPDTQDGVVGRALAICRRLVSPKLEHSEASVGSRRPSRRRSLWRPRSCGHIQAACDLPVRF
jgi:hypothetical protein